MANLKFGDEESIAAAAAAARPEERMRLSFGSLPGKTCGDCRYFERDSFGAQCNIFQRTGRCRTWKPTADACGKFEEKGGMPT